MRYKNKIEALHQQVEQLQAQTVPVRTEPIKEKPLTTTDASGKICVLPKRKAWRPIRGDELEAMQIPEIQWVAKDLLPAGLAILASPPKYFKSFMAIHLCMCIASGERFLGHEITKGTALYCDFESKERRPRSRALLISEHIPANLQFLTSDDLIDEDGKPITLGNGFEEHLTEFLAENADVRIVVIDVLQCIRPVRRGKADAYAVDYEEMRRLKRIADEYGICLLLVHHLRKMIDGDAFNMISGSVGVMGAVDTALVITKEDRFSDEAKLSVTGRDVESRELSIRWNKEAFKWELIGDAAQIAEEKAARTFRDDPIVRTVCALVSQNNGSWEGSAHDIQFASQCLDSGKHYIHTDQRVIGRFINQHKAEFQHYESITISDKKLREKNVFIFHSFH